MKQVYLVCFSVIWILALFTDYWNKHLLHQLGLEHFSHWLYISIVGVTALAIGLLLSRANSTSRLLKVLKSKIMLVPYFLFLILLLFLVNAKYTNVDIDLNSIGQVLSVGLTSILLLSLIWIAPYSLGDFVLRKINYELARGHSFTVNLVIGLGVYSLALFALSLLGLLNVFCVIVLIIGCLAINVKYMWHWFIATFLVPNDSQFSWIAWILFSVILVTFSINFFTDMVPFPNGFDSRNYYMNVTKLVAENHGLIPGFQPYPWQLFMAQGNLLTGGGGMLPQLISMSTVIFILIGAYELCVKYLTINRNHTYLALALFIVTPAVQNHLFIEIKVDLGLVLTQIALLIMVVDNFVKFSQTQKPPNLMNLIMIGFVTGYGLSIKTLNFYLVFALLVAIWSLVFRFKGFLATFCISIGAILIAKFDSVTGMNVYHESVDLVKYGCLIIGLGSLVWIAVSERSTLLKTMKSTVIYIGIMLLTFSPWLVKNLVETKSTDPNTLIRGLEPGPDINMKVIRKNYPPK